ncbi:TPA: restriction endonuclease subunit S, partial [Escherichia coli]|nr:restriction endonuclease subunit S [Escherichia coli]HCP5463390.1 restriction endonuclease subunit S [Escherichia coli]HCP5472313.1 restriction endonuclease subunit S [Escherichia coli]HCP5758393.1 restriction endonuclease subunit S [Escherichia coli]HCP5763132.1 restriction endonuclease subunit S [Escherichia coli]
ISEEEKPFELPEGWEWTRLGFISNYGFCDKAEPEDVTPETWILELEDIEKVTSKLLNKVTFAERPFKSSKNRFSQGDVLYGKLRPYLDKVIVANEPGVCTTEIIPITSYGNIYPEFLRLLLKAPNFITYANSSTHGMNLPRLGTEKAQQAVIELAPIQEQLRIVSRVDKLMSLCDQLEQQSLTSLDAHQQLVETLLGTLTDSQNAEELAENWARISEHFDTLFTTEASVDALKQTILQLAVMGKLVPQDPNDEPASELLKRIAQEKAQLVKEGKIKKQKPLPPISDEEKPFELPNGWEWCRLGELIDSIDAGWSPACSSEPAAPGEWGVLKTTAVQSLEYREYENKALPKNKAPRPQLEVKAGDILITRAGPKNRVGISCLVEKTRENLMISDKIIRFHLISEDISEKYISLCLNYGFTSTYLENSKSGMAESQMNISQDILKMAPIAIPTTHEQLKITDKTNKMMDYFITLKSQIQSAKQTQLHLADALTDAAIN